MADGTIFDGKFYFEKNQNKVKKFVLITLRSESNWYSLREKLGLGVK